MGATPKVYVIGVGMTKFEKPGKRNDFDYPQMVKESVTKALSDANVKYTDLKQAVVGYVYGESTSGQRALYEIGMTSIPIYNVTSNCSTGANALILAKQLIETGQNDCVLAVGFEKMEPGSLGAKYTDRTLPMDKHIELMSNQFEITGAPITAQMFGNAGIEHMRKYGTKTEHFAKIAYKNHKHSVNNPYAQFQEEYTLQQVVNSPQVHDFLTRLQCSPTSDGSAACILASEDFVRRNNLQQKAVEIVGMEMTTDPVTTFSEGSMIKAIGYDMTKLAAERLFAKTQCKPQDVDVIELHDCFSTNELITYEALGLCAPGEGGKLVDRNDNTYGGKYVINPSGGLISKGHPLGATGLAQCAELSWQLRNEAGKRQVPNAKLALQHNIGLGGAVVVALYRLGFPSASSAAPKKAEQKATSPSTTAVKGGLSPDGQGFLASPYLRVLEQAMQEDEDKLIEKVRGVYGFRVTNGPNGSIGYWVINAKTGKGSVTYNGKDKPDVTFIMKDVDVVDLISGKLQPQKAFFQGKVKVQGNMGLAMKLIDLQKHAQSRIEELRAKL